MTTPEQSTTKRLIEACRMIAEARPEQIRRLLKDIASSDGPERHA
ncbi:hypothetical protein PVV74_13510 [Roseovarius sp. SK2]|nr:MULTISPECIES: hypothetical protein [Roseovarius]MDD9726481.1 hypothetical protein [Roseovarius sp. SK2]